MREASRVRLIAWERGNSDSLKSANDESRSVECDEETIFDWFNDGLRLETEIDGSVMDGDIGFIPAASKENNQTPMSRSFRENRDPFFS